MRGSGTRPGLGRVEETRPARARTSCSDPPPWPEQTCHVPGPSGPSLGKSGGPARSTASGVSRPGLTAAPWAGVPSRAHGSLGAAGREPQGDSAGCWAGSAGRPASGRFLPLPKRDPGLCAKSPRLTEGLEHVLAPLGLALSSSHPSPGGTSCGPAQGPIPAGHRRQV